MSALGFILLAGGGAAAVGLHQLGANPMVQPTHHEVILLDASGTMVPDSACAALTSRVEALAQGLPDHELRIDVLQIGNAKSGEAPIELGHIDIQPEASVLRKDADLQARKSKLETLTTDACANLQPTPTSPLRAALATSITRVQACDTEGNSCHLTFATDGMEHLGSGRKPDPTPLDLHGIPLTMCGLASRQVRDHRAPSPTTLQEAWSHRLTGGEVEYLPFCS